MKRLQNSLYVLSKDAYLTLDGENIVSSTGGKETGRIPLHLLESVFCFSYRGASPALLGACGERGIGFAFFSPGGRFLARIQGSQAGNVLLRKEQFRKSEIEDESLKIARGLIGGKVYNSRRVLLRALRDHKLRIDADAVESASARLYEAQSSIANCLTLDSLRGIEGDAASVYFSVFNELILRNKDTFRFEHRSRRPPTDEVNAMLSLFYTVLAHDCASALEGVGLDPYTGMLHADRPGRKSFALDLMEELRPIMADRFVVTAINNQIVGEHDFNHRETGEVRLTDAGRRKLFKTWQERKKDTVTHPFLREKIPWGLIPHAQALLLARFLRGDCDAYAPFLWKG